LEKTPTAIKEDVSPTGQYLEGFKPSPTPLELVQQQAGKPPSTASIRLDHILDGGVNVRLDGSKSGTGGHYLRSPNVQNR